jgi:hypothetical protein
MIPSFKQFLKENTDHPTHKTIENFKANKKTGDPYYHKHELVPTHELLKYREYDRSKQEKYPGHFEDVKSAIAKNGITDAGILMYHPKTHHAYVGEGNTRISAAHALGISHVPMRVTRWHNENPKSSPAPHPYKGTGHVPGDLRPSDIGFSHLDPDKKVNENTRFGLNYSQFGVIHPNGKDIPAQRHHAIHNDISIASGLGNIKNAVNKKGAVRYYHRASETGIEVNRAHKDALKHAIEKLKSTPPHHNISLDINDDKKGKSSKDFQSPQKAIAHLKTKLRESFGLITHTGKDLKPGKGDESHFDIAQKHGYEDAGDVVNNGGLRYFHHHTYSGIELKNDPKAKQMAVDHIKKNVHPNSAVYLDIHHRVGHTTHVKAHEFENPKKAIAHLNSLHEDGVAPTNNVGSGHIAGAGVGPQGEPGVSPERQKRKKKKRILLPETGNGMISFTEFIKKVS